jgi:hypothetical protein
MSCELADAYWKEATAVARQAFSFWQREPSSPSFGCFDRQYWGWKKKDLADATLQAAVNVAVRFAENEGKTTSLPMLLEGYVAFLERIQHRDGSFDQIYPYERAPGVVHDILSPLISLWRSQHLEDSVRRRLEAVIHRAVAYALTADEKHGEIANHFAHYAWELIQYGTLFDEPKALAYGHRYLERTLGLFRPQEGWFLEYDGADAGYQSRLLAFLARIAELTNDAALWATIGRGARFIEATLMPDGSLHPMLGVRSTALLYPSAFERLARRSPEFGPLADKIHLSWSTGASPLPTALDFENALRLADDAFEASDNRTAREFVTPASDKPSETPLPPSDNFDLNEAGLHRRVAADPVGRHTLMVASRLGGPVVIYAEAPAGRPYLVHEDAGYLLRLPDGSCWSTRRAGAGTLIANNRDEIALTTGFQRALHEDLTPFKMIVLRLLNLTLLRSQWIGDVFRRIIVRRLISGQEALPLTCHRTIVIGPDATIIRDRLVAAPELASRLEGAQLFRCRRTIGNHMASSRYFQSQELACEQPWLEELPLDHLDGKLREVRIDAARTAIISGEK